MEKEKFYYVINKLVLPLFTGSTLVGEEESTAREAEIALGKQNTLLIKPQRTAEYRLVLKRGRAYQPFELTLLKNILKETREVSEGGFDESYEATLLDKAVEKAICDTVAPTASVTMLSLVDELTNWSNRTYEGKRINFGIILNLNEQVETLPLHFSNMLSSDFFALLSDGKNSFVEFNRDGYLMGYVTLAKVRNNVSSTAPHMFNYVAKYCGDKKIGIALTQNGDLLIFKNRILMFAKRRGQWSIYNHEEVMQLLSYRNPHSLKEVRRAIYLTAIDTSFKYSGGIIVYLKRDMALGALAHIDARDILEEKYYDLKKVSELEEANKLYNLSSADDTREFYSLNYNDFLNKNACYKSLCLKQIIQGKKFHELNRKLREEIVAMDGATIIDFDGTIIAAGAILKIEAGSIAGGGRSAAAMDLARYGISLKISQDGFIQGYVADKNGTHQLFTVS